MRYLLLVIVLLTISSSASSQTWEADLERREDSLRKQNWGLTISDLFWNSDSDELCYLGISNSYEMNSYCIGGEFKLYGSLFDPWFSTSLYGNFRTSVHHFADVPDFNVASVGGHLGIIGGEVNWYFYENADYYYFTPKIGFDYGSWSAFYGYNCAISKSEYNGSYRHNLSLKYHLYLSAFTYHKMRKKSYGY